MLKVSSPLRLRLFESNQIRVVSRRGRWLKFNNYMNLFITSGDPELAPVSCTQGDCNSLL